MSTHNEQLYKDVLETVMELFSDDSVSKDECKANLLTLISEIETLVESLGG